MITTKSALAIAESINAAGRTHYNQRAKGWISPAESRIYFGRDYVRILNTGEITNAKEGRGRALTIGDSAVALVEEFAA